MDWVLWIGVAAITINFVLQTIKTILAMRRLESYLLERHPQEYRHIYLDGWMRKAFLWPFTTETNPVEFVVRSREDFGDPQVAIRRAHVKQAFVLMVITMIALAAWCITFGLVLPAVFDREAVF